jgi:hypothetical protein
MVSLSTIYGVSIVLGSLAAVGSAIAGTKVYPIQTGGDPLAGPALLGATLTGAFAAAKKAIEPKPEPLATETVKKETPIEEAPVVEEPVVEDEKSKVVFENNPIGESVRTYTPESNQHDKVVYIEKAPSEFFNQQLNFYKSLSDEDKKILKSYTKHGDSIINSISRNNYTESQLLKEISKINDEGYDIPLLFGVQFKDITSENVVNVSKKYFTKFKTVFDKVPSVTSEFKVFRGTQEPTSNFIGFISTTYDPMSGILYDVFTGPSCCIYELTVMPGTKALWLEPISEFSNEQEILLNDTSKITITKETTKEVWKLLTKISSLNKLNKTVYEGTVQAVEEAPSVIAGPPAPVSSE